MSSIVKHTNVKVVAEKASSTHETHFLQLNDQLELKISDDDVLTQLISLDGNLVDIETILNTQTTTNHADFNILGTKTDATNTKLDTLETTADAILAKNTEIETLVTQLDVVADACLVKHTNNETLLTQLDVVANDSLAKLTEFAEVVEEILDDLTVSVGGTFSAEYHKGIGMYAVRQDTQAHFGDDGDYVPLGIDSHGELRVKLDDNSKEVLNQIQTNGDNIQTKLDTLETSNQLNKGFLEQIEGHIETMSENQSTFASGDEVVVTGVSTSALQSTTHGKLDILETSNQLIKNNGIRAWGTLQTIEGNLVVSASSTHSGSSSFVTIPTKPILIYVKSHGVITDWFANFQGSIDNSIWMSIPTTEIATLNLQRNTPEQQAAVYVNNPSFPYIRVIITNENSAARGFEIKINQTT